MVYRYSVAVAAVFTFTASHPSVFYIHRHSLLGAPAHAESCQGVLYDALSLPLVFGSGVHIPETSSPTISLCFSYLACLKKHVYIS